MGGAPQASGRKSVFSIESFMINPATTYRKHSMYRFGIIISCTILTIIMFLIPDASYAKRASVKRDYKIVVMGDDLVSGKGLFPEDERFDVALQRAGEDKSNAILNVVTIAQDGGTAVSLLPLIPHVMAEKPDIVVLVIGYNDALARNDPDVIYNNLDTLLKELDRVGAYVFIVGIEAPYDAEHSYAQRFNNIYPSLAQRYRVVYHNGFIANVQGYPLYTQEDRYHPNRLGVEIMAKNIAPSLVHMIETIRRRNYCNKSAYHRHKKGCQKYFAQ